MFAEHMGCNVVSAPVVGGGAGGHRALNDGHTAVRGSDNDNSAVHVSYLYKWRSAGRLVHFGHIGEEFDASQFFNCFFLGA